MALLEIKNLTVSFDTSTGPFKAVDGIDITVDKGEVLAIVGESGSASRLECSPSWASCPSRQPLPQTS
jgi:ABC-type antimicrobial peptide transport system ATPase subunit